MKLKKTLGLLASLGMTALVSSNVISCVAPKYASGEEGQRAVLVTDGGRIDDRAFNQDSFKGIQDYMKSEYGINAPNNYIESSDFSNTAKISGYRMAAIKKANAIVLPGFTHLDSIAQGVKFLQDKTIVMVDASVDYKNPDYKNVISVSYDSQFAGIQAGFDASYWATRKDAKGNLNGDKDGNGKITIGAFAGASNKYGVDNYVWGLFVGMELYNQLIAIPENDIPVYFGNAGVEGKIENLNPAGNADNHFFSGSFAMGDAIKSGVLSYLVDKNKSDIIFPVAGAQITDAINYESKNVGNNYSPYIIGVDVDQTESYPQAAKQGRFITSAIKNLHDSVKVSLEHAASLVDKNGNKRQETWDGRAAAPMKNWSIDLISGKNRINKHKFVLFDEQNDPGSNKGNEAVTEKDQFMTAVNKIFSTSGSEPTEYLNGQNLTKWVEELLETINANDGAIRNKIIDPETNEENISNPLYE